jgi:hypothetical protein
MNSSASPGRGRNRWQGKIWRAGRLTGLSALGGALVICQAAPLHISLFRHEFHPDNVFAYPARLSLDFRRVAVMPLAAAAAGSDLADGCGILAPVLFDRLVKTKKFEVVAVDADKLRSATGRAAWTGNEVLPADFLAYLHREYGCDGVLFAELTSYHAYAPLAVGWRFKLVDVRSGQILWSADELFDAAQPAIGRAAQQFEQPRPFLPGFYEENWVAMNSPRQFGSFSVAALLATLPER